MTSLTAEQKNAEMSSERAFLARLFQASIDSFEALEKAVDEYTRQHLDVSAIDVLTQFKDANKRTVLHFASRGPILAQVLTASWWERASVTTARGMAIRAKDKDGMTPLMLAAQVEDRILAETNVLLLLQYAGDGPKPALARSHAGATALHYAAGAGGTAKCIQALYGNGPVALQTSSRQGGMPLHWACAVAPPKDCMKTIRALLDCGADPNAAVDPIPPPLHMCLAAGSIRHAQLLLQYAQDRAISLQPSINYQLPGRVTLFHMTADMNMVGLLATLLQLNDNPTLPVQPSDLGVTPLQLAAQEGHVGCVLLLLPGNSRTEDDAYAYIEEVRAEQSSASPATASSSATTLPPKPDRADQSEEEPNELEEQAKERANAILARTDPITAAMRAQAQDCKRQGNCHFAEKQYEEACAAYSQAIECDPTDATFYSNRSACHLLLHQPDPALQDAVMARVLKPDWPKAAYRLAAARLELERYEDAAVAAWEGLAQDPDNDELKSLLQKCVKRGQRQHRQAKSKSSAKS